jgi:hypothetical protein
VLVAVRTPDNRLAGQLREDLPALSTRLEQSGFRAEVWHPAAASERPHVVYAPAAAAQDAQNQSRQDGRGRRQEQQEQQQKAPANGGKPSSGKEGKDFAWLLSSIR